MAGDKWHGRVLYIPMVEPLGTILQFFIGVRHVEQNIFD
jgi:hypothetical protein